MWLLASDFDKTLLCNNAVSKEDLDTINIFRDKGNLFGIITGRSISMIEYDLEYYGVKYDFLVCNNGGIICDENLKVIIRHDIDLDIANEMIEVFSQNIDMMIGVSDGDVFGVVSEGNVETPEDFIPPLKTKNVDYQEILNKGLINSILVKDRTESLTLKLQKSLLDKYSTKISAHFNNGTLDINAMGISKANALYELEEHFNVNKLQVIGDGYNDLEMIKEFKGFAMNNGVDIVKENAQFIVKSVEECINYLLESEK